jgi:hypothetical protein
MIIEVGMDYDFASIPDELHTGGAGPCIIVAALNETKGEAGLLHTPGAQATADLDAFLSGFNWSETDLVRILITGGDTSGDSQGSDVRGDRRVVKKRVRMTFPTAKIKVKWVYRLWCNVTVTTDPPDIIREVFVSPF